MPFPICGHAFDGRPLPRARGCPQPRVQRWPWRPQPPARRAGSDAERCRSESGGPHGPLSRRQVDRLGHGSGSGTLADASRGHFRALALRDVRSGPADLLEPSYVGESSHPRRSDRCPATARCLATARAMDPGCTRPRRRARRSARDPPQLSSRHDTPELPASRPTGRDLGTGCPAGSGFPARRRAGRTSLPQRFSWEACDRHIHRPGLH